MMRELDRFEQTGTDIALEAGKLLMERFRGDFEITRKGIINLVTEVDLAAEKLIVSRLLAEFPHHRILAEENHAESKQGSHVWIIDPLDGTTNYSHGFPVFCVSIGLEIEGDVEFGVIYNPVLDELFVARKGKGARCNGSPLRVSKIESLDSSLLATGFPYDIRTNEANNLDNFREFALRAQAVRRAGSAALDLAYVAAGRFEGFWELGLNPWDTAAGYLLVREAGGVVTDFRGEQGSIYVKRCVASNGLIHEEMLEVLRHVGALTKLS